MPTVNIQQSLKAGVQGWIKDTWRQVVPTMAYLEEIFVKKLPYSSIRDVAMVFKESLPFPGLWKYGSPRTYTTIQDRFIHALMIPYSIAVPYSHYDEIDDQISDLKTHVQMSVKGFHRVAPVLISEYLNGSAVLNPDLNNCYDGVSLFSTVDGDSGHRFGVNGGNIISGSGITPAGFIHDLSLAMQRFMEMVDPVAKKPIYDPENVEYKQLQVIVPTSYTELIYKVSGTEYIRSDAGVTQAESNWVKGTFKFKINPYLVDQSDWYVIAKHEYWKPFVFRTPDSIESIIADRFNSDKARETNEYCFFADTREAITPWFPGCIIKVDY